MSTKIRDYKGELIQCINQVDVLNSKMPLNSDWSKAREEIQAKVDKTEPSLMFYGIYNAGKSSLLNAIFGEQKASVADVPETHRVTAYRWNNFELVDTPGVNGPEKDFKLSRSELGKHNVIMFVIDDSDTFDSSFVATEIVDIIAAGKPLIIVLNNKQNSDASKFDAIRNKLYENISKAGALKGLSHIEQKYAFIVVNANMAYKGKTEHKDVLLKMSKVQDLEMMITESLREIDEIKMLKLPAQMLLERAQAYNEMLKQEMVQNEEQYFMELLQNLGEHKNTAIQQMNMEIKRQIRQYNELIYSAVISGQEIESLQQELMEKINKSLTLQMEVFSTYCQQQFTILLQEPKFKVQMSNKSQMSSELPEFRTSEIKEDSVFDGVIAAALVGMPLPPIIIPTPIPIPIPAPVVIAVVKGIVNLFKGNKDEKRKQLEEMQYQAEMANAQQREAINQRINAMQEARTQVTLQLHKFEEEALKVTAENITAAYEQVKGEIEKLMSEANEKLNDFKTNFESINQVQMQLNAFINELE